MTHHDDPSDVAIYAIKMRDERDLLVDQNEHLRLVVEEYEKLRHSHGLDHCAWCSCDGMIESDHDNDCWVFTPDGLVK